VKKVRSGEVGAGEENSQLPILSGELPMVNATC
jgi:hypothetical protein